MKKVVVVGGGFAGSQIAKELENNFDVILIDTKDYFEFTPGILRTIVEPTHIKKIQVLHTHYLKKAKVIVGEVGEIAEKYVKVKNKKINFDYLAICSGSRYNVPIKEQNIIVTTRANHLRNCYKRLCKSKSILIIGGGLVGVELCAEILEKYKDKEITIVHAHNKLIERNNSKTISYAEKFLRRRGVKIIFNERIEKGDGKNFLTDKRTRIKADIAFQCTGITSNFEFMRKNFKKFLNKKNQIKVNSYLQLEGMRNIFAAGDITDRSVEKTAQNSIIQAKIVSSNINALESKDNLKEYNSRKTPLIISLGKYYGIFTWGNFTFTGIIPGLMKTIIEKIEMLKYKY